MIGLVQRDEALGMFRRPKDLGRVLDPDDRVEIIWVPGAWEIPLAAKKAAESGRFAAIIACGAVIRGATAHFDYVAGGVSSGAAAVSVETGIPVMEVTPQVVYG